MANTSALTYAPSMLRALAAIGGLAFASRMVYGPAFETYDPVWSLIWGRQLARGELPDLEVAGAPTSHPLANLLGVFGSLFGQGGTEFLEVASFLSFGFLGWACFRLGHAVYGRGVGVVFAALALTRPPIVFETLETIIDIPFLGLVVLAASLEAQRPRRGLPVLALLGAAGLLRPEAWLLAAAYWIYLSAGRPRREAARWALAVAAAPLFWLLFDLLATGDPFHSLQGTRELAGALDRPRGADTALVALPRYLEYVMAEALLLAGLAGLLAGLARLYRQSLLPAAILAIGLLSFLALGPVGLPLLFRYVFLPALMLCLFAAVALAGWAEVPAGRDRRVWGTGAALLAVTLAVFMAPAELDRLRDGAQEARTTAEGQRALRKLLESEPARSVLRRCGQVYVEGFLDRPVVRPLVAYRLDVAPESVQTRLPRGSRAAVLVRGRLSAGPRLRRVAERGELAVYESACP